MHQPGYAPDEHAVTDMLYRRYAATIFGYVRLHISSREDAEDIVVDIFLAALEESKFLQFSEKEQIAWLWRVARNKLIDSYRRMNVHRNIPLEIAGDFYEDEEQSPEQATLRQEEEDEVLTLLKRLPPGHQEVMRLRFGYGFRCAEIATVTGKRESAVRTTLSRALNLLRKIYEER